jgi:hypothetical protein
MNINHPILLKGTGKKLKKLDKYFKTFGLKKDLKKHQVKGNFPMFHSEKDV